MQVEFSPTEVDIVSTKLRTWNLKHPGNMYYTELVHKKVASIEFDDQSEYRRVATEIVDELTVKRAGRFLKLKEGDKDPTTCIVMDRRLCINKVTHALRTAQSKSNIVIFAGPKKKKMAEREKKGGDSAREKTQPKRVKSKRLVEGAIVYKARSGNKPIGTNMLKLISLVCNQQDPLSAFKVLDDPTEEYTLENEPDKHRLMRLQVCAFSLKNY
jgi:hypothetical protein